MRGRFATFALIAAVVLAGCTSTPGHPENPDPAAPTTSGPAPAPTTAPVSDPPDTHSTPTAPPPATGTEIPADVPTTGPNLRHKGERPPVMPLLATKHTPAGAVAFAKFFIQTIDWGFATTSSAYMRHYYAPSCVDCENHAAGLDLTRKAGSHYVGGRFAISSAKVARHTDHPTSSASVIVTFALTAVEVIDSAGNFVRGDKGHRGYRQQLWLTWHHGAWQVVYGKFLA